jgi:hypothetical protein
MALKLFGFKSKPPVDLQMEQLPVPEDLRSLIIRRHGAVLAKKQPIVARHQSMPGHFKWPVNIHFSMVNQDDRTDRVLIMFEALAAEEEKKSPPAKRKKTHKRRSVSG